MSRVRRAVVRDHPTILPAIRENVRTQLRVLVKRILRAHGYPPDKQEKATWRVTFRFVGPDVTDVNYEDYH